MTMNPVTLEVRQKWGVLATHTLNTYSSLSSTHITDTTVQCDGTEARKSEGALLAAKPQQNWRSTGTGCESILLWPSRLLLILPWQKPHKTLFTPPILHDRITEIPRTHWTGLAIQEQYWLSEDIELRDAFDSPPKDIQRHHPAESRRADSNLFASSSSCVPTTPDQPTVIIPHPNLDHNVNLSKLQEEITHSQNNTLVQVPATVFFEQDFSFSGDDIVIFEDNDAYPGSKVSGYSDHFISSSDPEQHCGTWTAEDEQKFAEMLAQYCHGQGLTSWRWC